MNRSSLSGIARHFFALFLLTALAATPAAARPLITEDVEPIGRFNFESGIAASYRHDAFNSPKIEYETVTLPVEAKIGLASRFEAGFFLTFLSQRLDTETARYSGSRTALFSPALKYSPWDFFGVQFLWHAAVGEEGGQELPISRGDDFELKALFHVPTRCPIEFNLGYLFRDTYESRLGVEGGLEREVAPGDIAEASFAVEFPIRWGFSLLTEAAYYRTQSQSVDGIEAVDSDGEAADALVGLTWERGGWAIGTGIAFGLLDESHTSFDLQRGAGDYQLRWSASYRLKPRKPGQ